MLSAVPSLTLALLWGLGTVVISGDALEHRRAERSESRMSGAVHDTVAALTAERHASAVFLAAPAPASRQAMAAARARTDDAVATFRRRAAGDVEGADGEGRAAGLLRAALRELDRLSATRYTIDARGLEATGAVDAYGVPVEALYAASGAWVPEGDGELARWSAGLVAGYRAMDLIGREGALVAAAGGDGVLSAAERRAFAGLADAQRRLWDEERAQVPAAVHGRLIAPLLSAPAFAEFRDVEEGIAAATEDEARVDAQRWTATAQPLLLSLMSRHRQASRELAEERAARGDALWIRLGLVGGLGLLAVGASVVLAIHTGRTLHRELAALRGSARDLARRRLPAVLDRLVSGEPAGSETGLGSGVDVPPPPACTREVQEVAEELDAVWRGALAASDGQVSSRAGVRRIMLDVARRNQSLLHRQLAMLRDLEGRAEPGERDELRRLDHLTARMRRHAESLIILSGSVPPRPRRDPAPVAEVLRGAVAGIEDYERVSVLTPSRDGVVGAAVADLTHLLAELLENAAVFSPPNTGIRVMADRVGGGFAIEIEDRGLGMPAAELEAINARLAAPPEPDLADTDRLGLAVVARLAHRHGVRVSLRPSPYGGTTAIVLLPHELMVPAGLMDGDGSWALDGAGPAGPAPARALGPAPATAPEPAGKLRRFGWNAQESGVPPASPAPAGNPWSDDDTGSGTDPPPPREDRVNGPAAEPEETYAGLPRRRRRQSLAPQLRGKDRTPPPPAGGPGPAGRMVRSPEEARSMMASIQQGWRRGRASDPGESGEEERPDDAQHRDR
ncbi:hypothetical protein Acsp03_29020 [Actinomadura sp. NBRC 104412]|nr:hypothetical protein Acsp03_29020 [Actinomadura sp. NBRC 104412]